MLPDNVWSAAWLYCESIDNQILLYLKCSELKKNWLTLWWKSHLHQVLELIVTTRTVILISYFSFHQPWLPHPISLKLWKQNAVWTIQRFILFSLFFLQIAIFYSCYTIIIQLTLQTCWSCCTCWTQTERSLHFIFTAMQDSWSRRFDHYSRPFSKGVWGFSGKTRS